MDTGLFPCTSSVAPWLPCPPSLPPTPPPAQGFPFTPNRQIAKNQKERTPHMGGTPSKNVLNSHNGLLFFLSTRVRQILFMMRPIYISSFFFNFFFPSFVVSSQDWRFRVRVLSPLDHSSLVTSPRRLSVYGQSFNGLLRPFFFCTHIQHANL